MIHRVAIAALVAGLTAQMLKVVIELVRTRRLNLLRFFDNGCMPSSHTALVTALTIGVGRDAGIDSPLFAVTLLFSLYFVFEAAGLRMEVGNLARERLKELVGHTWGEVFGGFIYGALVAAVASF